MTIICILLHAVRLRRLTDKDFPLRALLTWDPERIRNYRMVLQENETGEIVVSNLFVYKLWGKNLSLLGFHEHYILYYF